MSMPAPAVAPRSSPWYELAPSAIDVDRLAAPALLAHIPADLGRACSIAGLEHAAFRLWSALAPPLPEPFGQITGAVFAGESLASFAAASKGGGMPRDLDAFMMVTAPDPEGIVRAVLDRTPNLRRLGLVLDGKLHKLDLQLPFEIHGRPNATPPTDPLLRHERE
jgi:hypothetical protein